MQITAGRYFCEPPMKAKNSGVGSPSSSEKMFLPVSMSTTDWWMCIAEPGSPDIGLAMKVAYMSWRSAASRIVRLNRKTWSASVERIAVAEVDLHLRRALLVDQRVDLEALRLGEVVDVVEQLVELVDRGDRIGLARRLRPARAAGRRLERIVGIGVRLDQVELDLRRHHRPPAAVRVELDDRGGAPGAARSRPAARRGDRRRG